jgi:glycosidase
VRDKLDYIQELGATAIWLSPTWPSSSYHGYDVTDFYSVAAQLGGDEAMRALVTEAHARDIKIILDLVCNHVSYEHPYFVEALSDPESEHRTLFTFDESEIGYRTFFGVRSMPQVNLQNERAREWMFAIARFWLREFDVDGFRLDHANGPGPGFWSEFQKACKEEKPDCFLFGEVVEPSPDYLSYAGRLDGLLDFGLNDSLRRTYGFGSYSEERFLRFLQRHQKFFQECGLLMPTFIDNHDLDRFLFIAGGDKSKLRAAAEIQFAMPGPPIIYYGTEVGMSQEFSVREIEGLVVSREPMVWGDGQDRELFTFYQALIDKRRQRRAWEQKEPDVAQAA